MRATASFRELMEDTKWEDYGTGNYEKCADCMVHCGYEGTAVADTVRNPLKALRIALGGVRTDGPMAPEIPIDGQRPAEYVFQDVIAATLRDGDGPRSVDGEQRRPGKSDQAA